MGHCKDCVFWTDDRIGRVTIAGSHKSGLCSLLSRGQNAISDGYGVSYQPALPQSFEDTVPMARIDGLGYGAVNNTLITHPEFGCIQHKHKRLTVLT